jgi:DNA mismatch endonuclease (patch repair protein)
LSNEEEVATSEQAGRRIAANLRAGIHSICRQASARRAKSMPDVFTKKKRSEVMGRIRSRGNKDTELALMKLLRREGITGWRRHVAVKIDGEHRTSNAEQRKSKKNAAEGKMRRSKSLVRCSMLNVRGSACAPRRVRPDFVFPKLRLAVFVDGCFWHGCPVHATRPKGNAQFWKKKLERNVARDREVNAALRRAGWRVLRIWEHELARKNGARLLRRLRRAVTGRAR